MFCYKCLMFYSKYYMFYYKCLMSYYRYYNIYYEWYIIYLKTSLNGFRQHISNDQNAYNPINNIKVWTKAGNHWKGNPYTPCQKFKPLGWANSKSFPSNQIHLPTAGMSFEDKKKATRNRIAFLKKLLLKLI